MDAHNEWADFFDDHARIYDENCFTKNTQAEIGFLIEALALSSGASILDMGCGTGRHSVELAKRGFRVTGVDLSKGMLGKARAKAAAAEVEVEWVNANAVEYESSAVFDAAICLCEGAFGLLGTGDDPIEQPTAILRDMARALRPGGRCLFTVLNGYAMARRAVPEKVAEGGFDPLTFCERSDCGPPGVEGPSPMRERGFVPTELRLLFRDAGLDVESIWGGTAGQWGRRPIDMDEMEIMILGRKGEA